MGSIPGPEKLLGEGNGYPLQYSLLENPMDRGAWWTTVHWISESDMTKQLNTFTFWINFCSSHCATSYLFYNWKLGKHIPMPVIKCATKRVLMASDQFSLVQFSCSVMSDSLRPHVLQHTRLPSSSPTLGAYSNSCPLSR